ncbi:hypothetical protein OUZ56_017078 [Daphnia magna]|uniref:Uncharacterized protein n=1 Tax=Daphnia magna TaxID=35525 RepID=A0ABR0AS36_9CRUS|nr:hypothetical protein OUZ56_017078 [Daphnia magna]
MQGGTYDSYGKESYGEVLGNTNKESSYWKFTLTWAADETGFQPKGDLLPVAPVHEYELPVSPVHIPFNGKCYKPTWSQSNVIQTTLILTSLFHPSSTCNSYQILSYIIITQTAFRSNNGASDPTPLVLAGSITGPAAHCTFFAVDELPRTSNHGLPHSFGTCSCNVYVFRRYHTCPCANELFEFWYANKLLRCWCDELYTTPTPPTAVTTIYANLAAMNNFFGSTPYPGTYGLFYTFANLTPP